MASARIISYINRDTPVHRLCGATKLLVFLVWTIVCMLTYNTYVLLGALVFGIIVFIIARIKLKEVKFVLLTVLFFILLNTVAIYVISPEEGVNIYGTRHEIFRFTSRYTVTQEQLFYMFNVMLKYFTVVPIALLFIVTTDPSEFAASLCKIGVSYKIAYAVSITLRYISDIQGDFVDIYQAQQARGVDISKNVSLKKRMKGIANIAVPLIFSSLDRIDFISNAMDLRGFGKNRKRTWYSERPFKTSDYVVMVGILLIGAAALYITFRNGSRFYNPFTQA